MFFMSTRKDEDMLSAVGIGNVATSKKQQDAKKSEYEDQMPFFISETKSSLFPLFGYEIMLGNEKKYKVENDKIINLLNTMSKYSTKDSPEITPEELYKIKNEVYKSIECNASGGVRDYNASRSYEGVMLDNFDILTKHYSDENSPGGKDITGEEAYDLADRLIDWQESTTSNSIFNRGKTVSDVIGVIKDNIGYGPYRIDAETQWKIKDEVYKNVENRCDEDVSVSESRAYFRTTECAVLDNFDKIMELISGEGSEAGEYLTVGEINDLCDLLEQWQ